MKRIKPTGRIKLWLAAAAFALTTHASTRAEVPGVINFQGILKDGSGNPVASGSYSVLFTIWDAPTGGSNLWSQTYSVTTSSGLFNVLLGSGPTPIPEATFNDTSRYLGIKVGADPEMTPRQPMTSVGFSFVSSQWSSLDSNVYHLNGSVGIGTIPLGAKLEVQDVSGTAVSAIGNFQGVYTTGGTYGVNATGGSYGVDGSSAGFAGVYGSGGTHGVYGQGFTDGVYGNGSTYGLYGTTPGSGDGVYGFSNSGNGVNAHGGTRGVYADGGSYGVVATTTTGTGVWAGSTSGAGVYATGAGNGVLAYSTSGAGLFASGGAGDGVYAVANGNGLVGSGAVRGAYVSGNSYGMVASVTADGGYAVYGSNGGYASWAGYFLGNVIVNGDFDCYGNKSAAVKMNNGEYHALYAQESPESWFEDFGTAQLVKGRAVVVIDPAFAQTVNTAIEYHVFLTPRGDCNGLYVSAETAGSFEIRELQKGKSDLAVSYRIVAKRKGYESVRLAKVDAPTPEEMRISDQNMRSDMAAQAASQDRLHAGMEAEHNRLEAERVSVEQQKSLANPSLQGEGVHR